MVVVVGSVHLKFGVGVFPHFALLSCGVKILLFGYLFFRGREFQNYTFTVVVILVDHIRTYNYTAYNFFLGYKVFLALDFDSVIN